MPIALAVLASFKLEPIVAYLERHLIPRLVGAPAALLLVFALSAGLSYSLLDVRWGDRITAGSRAAMRVKS